MPPHQRTRRTPTGAACPPQRVSRCDPADADPGTHNLASTFPVDQRARAAVSAYADSGLITLEWLVIVGAIAGLAAASMVIAQRVVDDATGVAADPAVRVFDADIAAAFLANEANEAALSVQYHDLVFRPRCETDLAGRFGDVVYDATWFPPVTTTLPPPQEPVLSNPARCVVTLRPDLGGL